LRAFAKGLRAQLGADMTGVADNDTEQMSDRGHDP
jgi:hypothetical protein